MRLRWQRLVNTKIYRLISGFRSRGYGFPDEPLRADGPSPPFVADAAGVIAVAAVVLMLLFVGILWRDIAATRYQRALERASTAMASAAGGAREADAGHHATSRRRWVR